MDSQCESFTAIVLQQRRCAVISRSKSKRGVATVPIFILAPQVKLPKRLDLGRNVQRAHEAIPGLIVARWVEDKL
jgi:hypothetical protein